MDTQLGLEQELTWARTHMVRVRQALEDLPGRCAIRPPASIWTSRWFRCWRGCSGAGHATLRDYL